MTAVEFGDLVDATPETKPRETVDLTPYKSALVTILAHPPMTKALPVLLTNERGHSAAAVKKRFDQALHELNGNVPEINTQQVKLVYRNANPGTLPIVKMYVKWTPLVTQNDATPETAVATKKAAK